jgi:hypothetical protein
LFHELVQNCGFGWDSDLKLPTAPDKTWKEYLKSHPKAKDFRYETLPYYEELKILFLPSLAIGQFASAGLQISKGTTAPVSDAAVTSLAALITPNHENPRRRPIDVAVENIAAANSNKLEFNKGDTGE